MTWLGDFPEDFATVVCMFTTHDGNGAPIAPLTAFENADVIIYKNGSATQKTSQNGVTMTSPFDSIVGLHCLVIDTSNDTGDSGFWTTGGGGLYTLVLSPDTETVNGQTVAKVIGQFGIALSPALRPTTAGRTLDVSATGEAGVDWANVGSPTTTLNLSGTTIKTATDIATATTTIQADTDDIQTRLPAALTSDGYMKADALKVNGSTPATLADVNAEMVDVIATDTYAEPGQSAPAATTTLAAKINYLFKSWRNKKTQDATTFSLYADDGTTVDQKSTVSDAAGVATRGEIASGP